MDNIEITKGQYSTKVIYFCYFSDNLPTHLESNSDTLDNEDFAPELGNMHESILSTENQRRKSNPSNINNNLNNNPSHD